MTVLHAVYTSHADAITRPRTNLDVWKGKLSTEVWNQLARASGAHLNSMEVFPLFAAAVVAGNVAKLPAEDMNAMVLSFVAVRTLYLGVYIGVKNNTLAQVRTAIWAWSISIPIMCLWRAGQAVANS